MECNDIPPVLKVACFDIELVEWTPHEAAGRSRFGEWAPLELCIRYDGTLPVTKFIHTILHEVGHAIYWAYDIHDSDQEERIVNAMATGWAQVFRDNPLFLKWLEANSFKGLPA